MFFSKKTEMKKQICLQKAKQINEKKRRFSKLKLAFFSLFQISNPNIFVIFVFFIKNIYF
jgi:hypothetical protein